MKKQAFNPYLPSFEYVPDAEPHIFDGRVYIYGSHDIFNGLSFCLGDYVCWSADIDNLGDWRFEGCIYKRNQEPGAEKLFKVFNGLAAPDLVKGKDGRFYLYYFMGGTKKISVAVCDSPAGKFEFFGHVKYPDGIAIGKKGEPFQFDPGVFMDDDGRLYLYTGFALTGNPILLDGSKPTKHGAMCFELEQDMLTVKGDFNYIGIAGKEESIGTPYEGHSFFEASSMRKFNGVYYFIYSSLQGHELCYATSDNPSGGFKFGGVLVSNGDIGIGESTSHKTAKNYTGNTHGSVIEIKGKYYVFYHRQTNRKQSSRQACAERLKFENGKFYQAEMTSCGLNDGALIGKGIYKSYIACNLFGKKGARFYSMLKHCKGSYPFLTQSGKDRDEGDDQYIANFREGAVAAFKYFDLSQTREISISLKGSARGKMIVSTQEKENIIAEIDVVPTKSVKSFSASLTPSIGRQALFFTFKGKGYSDFISFELL